MEDGLLDTQGYPIGSLYFLVDAITKHGSMGPDGAFDEKSFDVRSDEFRNNRWLFQLMGVPDTRISTVTPHIIATVRIHTRLGIDSDYDLGKNLPGELH